MRAFAHTLLALAAATAAVGPAAAQTPPATIGDHYVPAPWWMRDPVIASIGYVRVELPANRASFTADFQVVERTAPLATVKAADMVRALGAQLQAFGADKVRIVTTFNTQPLYEQYRDKEGAMIDNQRADKIERYQVRAQVALEVRDTSLLERAYATVMAAKPTSTTQVFFRLDPENETKTALYRQAIRDAARRARQGAEDAGAKIGAVKVIDPTGRACQTDVLAGWPSYGGSPGRPTTVNADELQSRDVATDAAAAAPSPPVMMKAAQAGLAGGDLRPEDMQLPLQPPLQEMTAESCVVYGLS